MSAPESIKLEPMIYYFKSPAGDSPNICERTLAFADGDGNQVIRGWELVPAAFKKYLDFAHTTGCATVLYQSSENEAVTEGRRLEEVWRRDQTGGLSRGQGLGMIGGLAIFSIGLLSMSRVMRRGMSGFLLVGSAVVTIAGVGLMFYYAAHRK